MHAAVHQAIKCYMQYFLKKQLEGQARLSCGEATFTSRKQIKFLTVRLKLPQAVHNLPIRYPRSNLPFLGEISVLNVFNNNSLSKHIEIKLLNI